MNWGLRQRLKQNDFVNIAYRLLTDKGYKDYCADYSRNARIFRFEHRGDENPGERLYLIQDGFESSGMFALIVRTLRRLEVADRFHFTPVVFWNEKVPYSVPGQPNTFQVYFQPVSGISVESAIHSQDVAYAKIWDRAYGSPALPYEVSIDEIERLAVIYQKYMKLCPELQRKIDQEIKGLFEEVSGKVLGVHVRGVEWRKMKVFGHPITAAEEDYLQVARDMMSNLGYKKIFLASDSDRTIDMFLAEFGDRLITTQAMRASEESGELAIFDKRNDGYQMGVEILRDTYALAACDSLVCGRSNVSYGARIINKAIATPYEKVMLLDKGIVEIGISTQEATRRQKKKIQRKNP